jgi:hypothetical protein
MSAAIGITIGRYRYRYKSFESDEKAAADESSRGL